MENTSQSKEETKMKNKLLRALAIGTAMTTMFSMGCLTSFASETETEAVTEAAAEDGEEAAEEEEDTGDCSNEDTRNADEIGDTELLVVSFGTSYNDNRQATIGAIEEAMEEAFPDYAVRRAFTSQIIIDKVAERDDKKFDNVGEALDRAMDNGVKTLVVQPTHLMDGLEYNDLLNELNEYTDNFDKVVLGNPLLTSDEDFDNVVTAITDATADYDDGETAIVFMGHGTEAESNEVYTQLQDKLAEAGKDNYFVGTVEAAPTLDDVLAKVQEGDYKKVVLRDLMVVAGDHAHNDMAGDEEGSWKTTFEDAGYEVECVLDGLGQLDAIQQMYVAHAQEAIDTLAGTETGTEAMTETGTEAGTEAVTEAGTEAVAETEAE